MLISEVQYEPLGYSLFKVEATVVLIHLDRHSVNPLVGQHVHVVGGWEIRELRKGVVDPVFVGRSCIRHTSPAELY